MIGVGLNGFGRFGLRLLRVWLKENAFANTNYEILQINDTFLSPIKIVQCLKNDPVIGPLGLPVKLAGNKIVVGNAEIELLAEPSPKRVPWSKKTLMVFECSGKFTRREEAVQHLRKSVRKVLISATSLSADKTIILGFNESEYKPSTHHIVSYGSCTTNCFLPVARLIHEQFGIASACASVIHNTPLDKISKPFGEILLKHCTLEFAGPKLFPVLGDFFVNYRMVPYPGVSLMDMQFLLKKKIRLQEVNNVLEKASAGGLKGIIKLSSSQKNSNSFIGSPFSAILIDDQTRVIGNQLLLSAWFDNENSATRFNDLAKIMAASL
ncbi:MAG: glyceraldehyde 3-phosphate dehydrogenase NAD-binding domain-containing protein [archaeon]|nr:glyceraldehyde 3-phosphate dehydrogenase NAD-binding domain-containing protein [archaeon]